MKDQVFEMKPNDIPWGASGLESPAIYAEYIRGAMVTATVTKLYLVENRIDVLADTVRTIPVVQIIIPTEQLRAWGAFFTQQADALGQPQSAQETTEAAGGADGDAA